MQRVLALLLMVQLTSCLSEGPPLSLRRMSDDDAGTTPRISAMPSGDAGVDLGTADPHGLVGVDPSHGPFNGGQVRIVRGNGFTSQLRVWFGSSEVPKQDIVPIDPARAQVVVPPGPAGPVDVKVQIGTDSSTARVLGGGYLYEDFYADPNNGPTSGGTIIHLFGSGTAWMPGTTVTVDDKACDNVRVLSGTELECTTPQSAAGAKTVKVTAIDKVSVVRDAFTYADSTNGFRGGLSGDKLSSRLKVLVYDDFTGDPIRGAFVLAGDDVATGLAKNTDAAGIAVFDDPSLGPKRSVTAAAECHEPTTFVDVPVDTVTVYLTPVLSPACASGGDPPSVGGRGILLSTIFGELVWPKDGEFRGSSWLNIPPPVLPSEKLVAYVFTLSYDPTERFTLPSPLLAVTPDSKGVAGFPFHVDTVLGNLTLYALAGIEDREAVPPKFTAYAMGVVRGVSATPGMSTWDVFIPMDIRLDHAVSVTAKTPAPGPRDPDRASFSLAVELEKGGYAIFPAGAQGSVLPVDRSLSFVGMPPLSAGLSGARYIASGIAATGPLLAAPLSQVGQFASTSESILLDAFVSVPVLDYPAFGGAWDGKRLSYSFAPSASPIDLTVLQIQSGGGLVTWLVAAPGGTRAITLPDLRTVFSKGSLVPGNVSINVTGGHIVGFDYGQLRYRQLNASGFDAYSADAFPARFE